MSESSLVIQTSFLGDMVLTTPLIAHLADPGPVDVVTHAGGERAAREPSGRARAHRVRQARRGARRPRLSPHGGGAASAALPQRLSRAGLGAQRRARAGRGHRRSRRVPDVGRPRVLHDADRRAARTCITRRGCCRSARAIRCARSRDDELRPRLYPGDAERAQVDAVARRARRAASDR